MITSAYHPESNWKEKRMNQVGHKVIQKGLKDTNKIMIELTHMERQGGMGTPSKILFS